MRLWAISDLHLSHPRNREALDDLPAHPNDWLILAGDISDGPKRLEGCFRRLGACAVERFAR
ncbi:MAG: metallophosphoesterase [Gammaproteobacteria bacterium]|nr:metallophosphoesterase [Gammaproteobacteria bacterium]